MISDLDARIKVLDYMYMLLSGHTYKFCDLFETTIRNMQSGFDFGVGGEVNLWCLWKMVQLKKNQL